VAGGGEALLTRRRSGGLPRIGALGGGLLRRRAWCAVLKVPRRCSAGALKGVVRGVAEKWSGWAAPCEGVLCCRGGAA
jgi:hypothetical protein